MQVECLRGKCATGGHCSNQMMQDGLNAMLSVRRLPGKEMSLFDPANFAGRICLPIHGGITDSEISVLVCVQELKGAKNYYGMAIESNEIGDVRVFGNIARLTNHSCQGKLRNVERVKVLRHHMRCYRVDTREQQDLLEFAGRASMTNID
ncbi:hypothetical protein PHMEG_00010187 [Phytophthora megakarya]|uniref:SET domain-containing protein n=1 Tax=Phytophthora megakarya TaxID=4795 RepID=A0A225WEB7_9STRA|nr:hypothetical protein PHMEG_00010187 [Phytophthora megakarya]